MKRTIPLSIALLVSVATALAGQRLLPQAEFVRLGAAYVVVAVGTFWWALRHAPAHHGFTPPSHLNKSEQIPLIRATPAQRSTLIAGSLVESVISNVIKYDGPGDPVCYQSGRANARNVHVSNVRNSE